MGKRIKEVEKTLRHWGYGYGNKDNAYGQTTTSPEGKLITERNISKAVNSLANKGEG